jgi:ubiquinone/menaquinone biosynthesis C-methylase UbiE
MYNKDFAKIYNTEWAGFSESLAEKILALTTNRRSVLDLGCGTGNFLRKLEKSFERTVGLDLSADMLEIAKQNCPKTKFVLASIDNFNIDEKFDLITCNYDTINHLKNLKEWQNMFDCVYKHLNQNGVFVFDFNTIFKMKQIYPNPITETEKYIIKSVNKVVDKNHLNMKMEIFDKANNLLAKVDQTESLYNETSIKNALKKSGFESTKFLNSKFLPLENFDVFRIFAVCKK